LKLCVIEFLKRYIMQEWTEQEVMSELLSEGKFSEIDGKMEPVVSFENLKRIVFHPRFPDSKSEKATGMIVAIQNHFNELNIKK